MERTGMFAHKPCMNCSTVHTTAAESYKYWPNRPK